MGASLQKEDREWMSKAIVKGKLTSYEEQKFLRIFDVQTDQDEADIKTRMIREKMFKRVCLTKLLVFPLEFVVSVFFLGIRASLAKKDAAVIYYKYYRGKISSDEFQIALSLLMEKGI